ncbi:hypothetical protein PQQ73_14185 [Paraburkholderia strydomiana]|uniref:Uncharacterized protein n=1 Tax=Paraburkholderia strydomiana TaxID=1245417 RepID=A0ABW9EG11_9BURK
MANSTTTLTGNEAFWGNLKITPQTLSLINKSPTLVAELLSYGAAVAAGTIGAMHQGTTGAIAFETNGIVFANNYQSWTLEMLVGNLAHEIGHYINAGADAAYRAEYTVSPNDPNAYGLNAMIGLHQEGEAAYNNWLVQQEITGNGGSQIYLAGQWATDANGNTVSTGLQALLDEQHSLDAAGGLTSNADKQWMLEDAMGVFSTLPNSVSGQTYFTYYGQANGAQPPAPGTLTDATFYDPNASGNITSIKETFSSGDIVTENFSGSTLGSSVTTDQFGNVLTQTIYSHNADGSYAATMYDAYGNPTGQEQFHKDGSETVFQFNRDGSQTAFVFDSQGNESEHATFGSNGKMTQDILYDTMTGRETQEMDWSTDGSSIAHLFNGDGTQNAIVYNAGGHETEYATFGKNGAKTQDIFYDATTGHATEQDDYNADGSAIASLFNANGTQNKIFYNAAGHQTEQAVFGSNGKITQDFVYDPTTGRETQETDWNADGSSIAHLFNGDSTQNAIVYDAAGHETEYATFGKNGAKTQDTFYDATAGRATEQDDYNADGSGVAHIFNADGTQNAAMFDPSGHISEYATFAANGALTNDAFFDATGRETQLNEYKGNQTIIHLLNADNSQTATVYNANGHETEFAKFSASGQKTDDYFFDGTTGRETEYDQYGSNGSMTAHLFNADNSQNAIIFNRNGQEIEYDSFDSSGKLTGFTQFTYGAGGGYDAVAYGPTGYELGWSDYSSNNMLLSSGGNQYDFTLDDSYDSGSDYFDFGWFDGISYSNEYGFYI